MKALSEAYGKAGHLQVHTAAAALCRYANMALKGLRSLGRIGLGSLGFGAHTRTIQARHMVRSLLSKTNLREPDPTTARYVPNMAEAIK